MAAAVATPPLTRGSLVGFLAWDTPARASYSPITPTMGFPDPHEATKAVGIPAIPRSTRKRWHSSSSARSLAESFSKNPSSA